MVIKYVSSRNLEKLNFSLAFLNIRDPEKMLVTGSPGSRVLRHSKVRQGSLRVSKSRDDTLFSSHNPHTTKKGTTEWK